jgi:hypothetical protein
VLFTHAQKRTLLARAGVEARRSTPRSPNALLPFVRGFVDIALVAGLARCFG